MAFCSCALTAATSLSAPSSVKQLSTKTSSCPSDQHLVRISSRRVLEPPSATDTTATTPSPCSQTFSAPRLATPGRSSRALTACQQVDRYQVTSDAYSDFQVQPQQISRLERSFLAEAVVGRVECNSKGCRPVFDLGIFSQPTQSETTIPTAASARSSSGADEAWIICPESPPARSGSSLSSPYASSLGFQSSPFTTSIEIQAPSSPSAYDLLMDSELAEDCLRNAVLESPMDVHALVKYAEFSWHRLHDKGQAERLFGRALEEEPENAAALASYALFLWQSEAI